MSYYNYHAVIKKLILGQNLIAVSIFKEYHNIKPAMVLYFDNHKPMPLREYKWREYEELILKSGIKIIDHRE